MSDDWALVWDAAEAQWVTGGSISVDLPAVAAQVLAEWDSPSLRVLAGMSGHEDPRDLRDVFLAAVDELHRPMPRLEDAARRLVRFYCSQVIIGTLAPLLAARSISRLAYDRTGDLEDWVMTFMALEEEASESWGRSPAEVEDAIRAEASRAVAVLVPR